MASTIQIKRSTTPGAVPADGTLQHGELALNVPDKKLFSANATGNTFNLSGDLYNLTSTNGSDQATITLTVDNETLSNDSIIFAAGEGIDIAESTGTITITGEYATVSNPGIASFLSADFDVDGSGGVSLEDTVVKVIATDSGSATPSTHQFTIAGTANEIETSGTSATVTVGLPNDVTIGNNLTVTTDLTVGGGYGSTGATITSAGVTSMNGALTVDGLSSLDGGIDVNGSVFTVSTAGAVVALSAEIGGGYGSTGMSITSGGALSMNGALTVDGLSSLDGGIDVNGSNFVVATDGGITTTDTLDVSGLASLDGGIDVDGVFTVADTTGNISTSGTLAITNTTQSTSAGSGAVTIDGGVGIDKDLFVGGNVDIGGDLQVSGNVTFIDSTAISIQDNIFELAANNTTGDSVDIGWYGIYNESGVKYAGIFRDASESSSVFKVWKNLTTRPGVTANIDTEGSLAQLDAIIDGGTY